MGGDLLHDAAVPDPEQPQAAGVAARGALRGADASERAEAVLRAGVHHRARAAAAEESGESGVESAESVVKSASASATINAINATSIYAINATINATSINAITAIPIPSLRAVSHPLSVPEPAEGVVQHDAVPGGEGEQHSRIHSDALAQDSGPCLLHVVSPGLSSLVQPARWLAKRLAVSSGAECV